MQGRGNAVTGQRDGGREGPNEVGMQSWGIGEGGEGAMLRGVQGSGYAVMGHMGVDREGHNEVGMRLWSIGRGAERGAGKMGCVYGA